MPTKHTQQELPFTRTRSTSVAQDAIEPTGSDEDYEMILVVDLAGRHRVLASSRRRREAEAVAYDAGPRRRAG